MASGSSFPEGAVFLGAVYEVASDGAQINEGAGKAYTLMVKDPQASETGGWRFVQYLPDGTRVELDEERACFRCHTQVKANDYVFSKPLDLPFPRPEPPASSPSSPSS